MHINKISENEYQILNNENCFFITDPLIYSEENINCILEKRINPDIFFSNYSNYQFHELNENHELFSFYITDFKHNVYNFENELIELLNIDTNRFIRSFFDSYSISSLENTLLSLSKMSTPSNPP